MNKNLQTETFYGSINNNANNASSNINSHRGHNLNFNRVNAHNSNNSNLYGNSNQSNTFENNNPCNNNSNNSNEDANNFFGNSAVNNSNSNIANNQSGNDLFGANEKRVDIINNKNLLAAEKGSAHNSYIHSMNSNAKRNIHPHKNTSINTRYEHNSTAEELAKKYESADNFFGDSPKNSVFSTANTGNTNSTANRNIKNQTFSNNNINNEVKNNNNNSNNNVFNNIHNFPNANTNANQNCNKSNLFGEDDNKDDGDIFSKGFSKLLDADKKSGNENKNLYNTNSDLSNPSISHTNKPERKFEIKENKNINSIQNVVNQNNKKTNLTPNALKNNPNNLNDSNISENKNVEHGNFFEKSLSNHNNNNSLKGNDFNSVFGGNDNNIHNNSLFNDADQNDANSFFLNNSMSNPSVNKRIESSTTRSVTNAKIPTARQPQINLNNKSDNKAANKVF